MDKTNLPPPITDLLPRIRRVVARLAEPQDVDDLTQDCCARVIEREALWDPKKGSREGWVQTIARNLTLNHLSRRRRRGEQTIEDDVIAEAPQREFSEDQIRWVLQQFQQLPRADREVLRMRYLDGLPTTEIAEKLGVSQPTASRRVQGAVQTLSSRARSHGFLASFLPASFAGKIVGIQKMPLAAAALLLTSGAFLWEDDLFEPTEDTYLVSDTRSLPETDFHPTLSAPLSSGKNAIWAATAPLAWQEWTKVLQEPPRFDRNVEIAELLNASTFDRDQLHPSSFVAGAGRVGDGFLAGMQGQLEETFGRGEDPELTRFAAGLPDGALLSYAFLARDLRFPFEWDDLGESPLMWDAGDEEPVAVESFGVLKIDLGRERHRKLKKLEVVERFESPDDFIVRLTGDSDSPEVILARMEPAATLSETIEIARSNMGTARLNMIYQGDRLQLPKLDFHLTDRFSELRSARIANEGYEGAPMLLMQTIRFRLDEKGATFRSRMIGAVGGRIVPRQFVLDGPFLLMMAEPSNGDDEKDPFLAIWVANPELLIPSP